MSGVLVDSSIWIDHINGGDDQLSLLLRRRRVVMHPMVIGEIALGSIRRRSALLAELDILPRAAAVPHLEVIAMIDRLELFNVGIGLVDAHLLASTRITPNATILTRDKRLHAQAERLGLAFTA